MCVCKINWVEKVLRLLEFGEGLRIEVDHVTLNDDISRRHRDAAIANLKYDELLRLNDNSPKKLSFNKRLAVFNFANMAHSFFIW